MHFTDPVDLFHAAVAALRVEDFLAVARLADPVSLAAFRRQILARFVPTVEPEPITAERLMRGMPDMPQAVAEYQAAQHRRYADLSLRLHDELPGVSSIDALRELDATQVFAAWLDGQSPRRHLERIVAAGHGDAKLLQLGKGIREHQYDLVVVGVTEDGPAVAFVLYRTQSHPERATSKQFTGYLAQLPADEKQLVLETQERATPHVARCRRQADGTWRLHVDHLFLSLESVGYVLDFTEPGDGDPSLDEGT